MGGIKDFFNPDKPKAPDYAQLAGQQAEEDRKTAAEITRWNRPTQIDPLGNKIEWTQDAAGNWTQSQTWAPGVQQQFQGQIDRANQAGDIYGNLLRQFGSQGAFDAPDMPTLTDGQEISDATYRLMTDRLVPEQQRQLSGLENRLRMQGLVPGTEAYDRAYRNLATSQGDVLSSAADRAIVAGRQYGLDKYGAELRGQQQGYNQALGQYRLPLDLASQAGNFASDRYQPSMPGFSGATGYQPRDIVGGANANYNVAMGDYNRQMQQKSDLVNKGMAFAGAF